MTETAVGKPETEHTVKERLAVTGDEARILRGVDAEGAESHDYLRDALDIIGTP